MNKKIISFVTAFFMIFTLFDFPAAVYAADSFGFTIDGDTLTNYYGNGGDVVVPDGVKHIAYIAFVNDTDVTSVTLPEGIETIGESAFNGCRNMTSINLPDSITSIGKSAFGNCGSLTEITIPAGVTSIEPFAFDNCRSLQEVTIHGNVGSIGDYAFRQCLALTHIDIPSSVKSIGVQAFVECPMTSITIPESVETIGTQAFMWCKRLKTVIYPDSLNIDNADVSAEAAKIAYHTNSDGGVTVTNIQLAGGETEVQLPEKINGVRVTFVDESVRDKVSSNGHTHKTETAATCTSKAVCSLCGEYGETLPHNYVNGTCTVCGKPEPQFDYSVINENEIRINGYIGHSTEAVIPETIDGKPVTTIYELNGENITKITIPQSVKMIYGAAFNYNKPSSLTEICFDGFSDGFVTVGTHAFPDTVTKITFPEGLNDNDVRRKMTLTVFPANAKLFSGTEPLPHDYVYVPDGRVHYQKCDACGDVKEGTSEAHAPQGAFITGKPGYNYQEYHYQECKCGMEMGTFHEWDDGSITVPATCTSAGVMTYICTVCEAEKTEGIPLLPHSYENGECTSCGAKDPDYSRPTDTTPDDTEPPVTQPPETDPSGTEPSVTQPPETDPSDTEPPVTAPPVTDPSDTEPLVTVPPVTAPAGTYPAATAPSNGYPLVISYSYTASSNEKIFEALAGASDGDTVVIDLNGNTSVDKSVFDEIKGRDVTVRFRLKGGAYWTINGKDIEQSRKVDLGVRMNRMSAPRDEIKELAGDKKTVKFTLSHNGKLGISGILNVPINEKYNGKYANLYYYSKGFEFVGSSLISDGYAQFRFEHASEYIIVIDDYPHGEDISAAAGAQCDDTPIDGSGHEDSGKAPAYFTDENKIRITNGKRRYRILKAEH